MTEMIPVRPVIVNTILLGGFMALSIVYTAARADTLSVEGISMFAMVLGFIAWNISCWSKLSSADILVLLGSCLYYAGYFIATDARVENIALYLSSIVFFVTLKHVRVDGYKISVALIMSWLLSIVLHPIELIDSFGATRVVDYFSGFFENSNTFAAFSTVVLSATFLFIKNQFIRRLVLGIFLVMLFAHHSRNTLLFILVFFMFHFLFLNGKGKLVPWLFLSIVLGALLYLIVIEPNIATSGFTLFGKKADTAGRSAQVLSVINHFDIRWFGNGLDTIGRYTYRFNNYALHNAWINTLYSMGILYSILYGVFVKKIYQSIPNTSKAFFLSSHIYFFFEPGLFFSILMVSSFPIIIAIISRRKYENSTL